MRGEQPWKTNRARVLRANATLAETKLWSRLRNRNLGGFKFARQVPIENYFVDFVCREARLFIEVDGATHSSDEERAADAEREAALRRQGYEVMRVTNVDVRENIEGVLDGVLAMLEGRV
ncbi:MAG: DUF559 domain-containing protein [Hyphomicrobiaceae bacterium]|nr:DUF559 domain-containing protein [Hyphomicrobiaceae bacterium]